MAAESSKTTSQKPSKSRRQKCKAKCKSTGNRCERWASDGFDVCMVHGAGTHKRVKKGTRNEPGRPIITGRYSKDVLKHPTIAKLIERFENDPNPMNLFSELAASRALFTDFLNRYELFTEALLAWHQSWMERDLSSYEMELIERLTSESDGTKEEKAKVAGAIEKLKQYCSNPRPRQVLDITDSYKVLSETTKIAERIKKMEVMEEDMVTRRNLNRLMGRMGEAVMEEIRAFDPDGKVGEAIAIKWEKIEL